MDTFDVVVAGGGAAGLSGAVALARSRRSVLVVDAGDPRNATAGHVHNFLTRDDVSPQQLYDVGRREVEHYGGRVELGRVRGLSREGRVFRVELTDRSVSARRLLVTTGSRDELPDVPGLAERWGIDVLHCPYCHGYEVRDQRIGVLATSAAALHQVLLFRQLSGTVTLLCHTGPEPSAEQREQLEALGVPLVTGEVSRVLAGSDGLTGVRLADGTDVALDALVVAPVSRARAELLAPLGLEPSEVRMGETLMGTQVTADPNGAPAAPGVWVAGNLADVRAQVVTSAAAELAAGAAINADLVTEDAARALEDHRHAAVQGEAAWDARYREHDGHIWSGEPNAALVAETADLTPGTALDAGAGEGGDALWLAGRGWRVTAADLSSVALERGERAAREAGLDVDWQHLDLTGSGRLGRYDLVTSAFLHPAAGERAAVFARLAEAVAPGGTLLVIGHDRSDARTSVARPGLEERGWSPEEVADSLGEGWVVDTCTARPRPGRDRDGREVTVHDAVVRAHRVPTS